VLQHIGVVRLIEALSGRVVGRDVLQHLIQNAETGVRDVAHRVLECPDDRVQHQLELLRRNGQERCHNTVTAINNNLLAASLIHGSIRQTQYTTLQSPLC